MGSSLARRAVAGLTMVALAGCGAPASPAATAASDVDEAPVCAAGPSTLRRLTREEYDATVRDLFGDDTAHAASFPPDENNLGYAVGAAVSPLLVELYRDAAEGVAERAVAQRLDAWTEGCAARDEACARRVIASLGPRAWRGPLAPASEARLLAAWRAGAEEGGFDEGLRVAIAAMLQAPRFLYLVEEPGAAAGVAPLSGHARAARLSYFLWGTTPDDALLAAADAGGLDTRAEVEAQARRMLADPRARESMDRFVVQWLELDVTGADKDPEVYPDWSPALAASMDRSLRRFFEHVVFDAEAGTLAALLTSREAFVDAQLAPIYGVEVAGDAMTRVSLPPAERAGLLTQAAVLAQRALPNDGSPVRRGKLVRERLFCHPLPPPPDGLATVPPQPEPGTTTRERYRRHAEDPVCVGCHELMDPIGFTFERYDGVGRYREAVNGRPLDARAEIVATRHTDGVVDGTVELAEHLAASPDVSSCFVRQMWRFALRRLESDEDACALARIDARFAETGGDVRELLVAIATSEPFLFRAPAPGGEDP